MNQRLRAMALALGLVAVVAVPATAAECGNITMPDSVAVNGQTMTLNGMGIRKATFLKIKVYVAGLYLADKSGDPSAIVSVDQPWRLVLNFVRDVGAKDIRDAWQDGFKKNAADQLAKLQDRIDTLRGHMVDFKKSDRLIFSYSPGAGTSVLVNDRETGTILGADFGSALIAIWLGDPPNGDLKQGLLGGECG